MHPQLALFPALVWIAGVSAIWCIGHTYGSGYEPTTPAIIRPFTFFAYNRDLHHLLVLSASYFPLLLIGTFLNVGLFHEIMRAFAGESPSLRRGLGFASDRIVPILIWSLFAATVGMVFNLIDSRLGWLGKIRSAVGGFAWGVAAVFVIPVLVRDGGADPIRVLRHSAGLVKNTWGEWVYGAVRLHMPQIGILVGIVLVVAGASLNEVVVKAGEPHRWVDAGWVAIIGTAVIFGVASTLCGAVYDCALYIFATEGVVPEPFCREDMDARWKIKGA